MQAMFLRGLVIAVVLTALSVSIIGAGVVGIYYAVRALGRVRKELRSMDGLIKKLIVWLLFSALFSFVPWLFAVFFGYLLVTFTPPSLVDLLRDGDLLYGAAGLSASSFGETLLSPRYGRGRTRADLILSVPNILIMQTGLTSGVLVSQAGELVAPPDPSIVMPVSLVLYTAAVVLGAISLVLHHFGEQRE
jgi:hypothetical protein